MWHWGKRRRRDSVRSETFVWKLAFGLPLLALATALATIWFVRPMLTVELPARAKGGQGAVPAPTSAPAPVTTAPADSERKPEAPDKE